jgi:hypothetical protein
MAFFENCVERPTALAATCGWLVFGGGAEAAVGLAIGAAGLSAVVSDAVRRHGPESDAAMEKMRKRIRADLERFAMAEGWDTRTDLDAADAAMERALVGCFLGRQELARSACDPEGFPEAATRLILGKLAEREPATFGSDGPQTAKDYAHRVIRAALEAALDNEDYFRRLQPHLLMETLRGLGTLRERQAALQDGVDNIQSMMMEMLRRIPETDAFEMTDIRIEVVVNDREKLIVVHNKRFLWDLSAFEYDVTERHLTFCFTNGFKKDFGTPVHRIFANYFDGYTDGRILAVLIDGTTGEPIEGDYFPLKLLASARPRPAS